MHQRPAAEHAAEAERLGEGEAFYRMWLANTLLGVAEMQALLNETSEQPEHGMMSAHQETLRAAGVAASDAMTLEFLQWRCRRIGLPLRRITNDPAVGAVPRAAAHVAEGLQRLLGVSAAGQRMGAEMFVGEQLGVDLYAARDDLQIAISNLDTMLNLLRTTQRVPIRPKYPF